MFAIENYDVQETRRIARNEGKIEGEREGMIKGAISIIKRTEITGKRSAPNSGTA